MKTARIALSAAVMTIAVLTGCGRSSAPHASSPSASNFAQDGTLESENYSTFTDMLAKRDLSIVGSVNRVALGPDESTLKTARVFVSSRKHGVVEVAFVLGSSASADATLKELTAALPTGPAVWVLRSIAQYPGVYRPVNQAAIIERAPNGKGQPAFYRGSAEAVRSDRKGIDDLDHLALIRDLNLADFESLTVKAEP